MMQSERFACRLAILFLLVASVASVGQDVATDDATNKWPLIWSDEFDRDGRPDPEKWDFEVGFVRNQEAQWYQPENAWCENGLLIIEARRETVPNPRYEPGSGDWKRSRQKAEYSSACLRTRGLHSWQYGRFEMRGRIDTRAGLWPAFWMLGTTGPWPSCGEIDIMEYYRGRLLANVAWGTDRRWVARWDTVEVPISALNDPDWSSRFHIWRMDWDKSSIKILVDGRLINETDLSRTRNLRPPPENPFWQPHYMLVNLAIGGTNGGDPSGTEFPARLEVDYVRVYQQPAGTAE
jgi:beta-glucanase (GH16 family)